jgi:DNA-binding MarR family transcriptional regulator
VAGRIPAPHGRGRTGTELRAAEAAGLAFAAPALARRLDITPQAALRLFARLEQAGLVREVMGRDSFRAFTLGVRSTVQCVT